MRFKRELILGCYWLHKQYMIIRVDIGDKISLYVLCLHGYCFFRLAYGETKNTASQHPKYYQFILKQPPSDLSPGMLRA